MLESVKLPNNHLLAGCEYDTESTQYELTTGQAMSICLCGAAVIIKKVIETEPVDGYKTFIQAPPVPEKARRGSVKKDAIPK